MTLPLCYLQTLVELGNGNNPITTCPIPIEFSKVLGKLGER